MIAKDILNLNRKKHIKTVINIEPINESQTLQEWVSAMTIQEWWRKAKGLPDYVYEDCFLFLKQLELFS